jgi:2-dehydro-3-deoxyphosphogluconate aldolase/(4S)-4-hydroxy-2-oxoglutarate aldolase
MTIPLGPALRSALEAERVIPVLRTERAGELSALIDHCREAGLGVVEITTSCPDWLEVVDTVVGGGLLVGVGTVLHEDQAHAALDHGADFLVSPCLVPKVRDAAADRAAVIQGGLTPTEISAAGSTAGLAKLYPASSVGIAHLRGLRDVFPEIGVIPTGGISSVNAEDWIRAGAVAVGIGNALVRMTATELGDLRERLREL